MKILLISVSNRLRLPGRNKDGSFINDRARDQVLLCYEICDEDRVWITTPVGRLDAAGSYVEHSEEAAMRLKLQQALGDKKMGVVSYPTPDGRARFEAVRVFPCEVEVTA